MRKQNDVGLTPVSSTCLSLTFNVKLLYIRGGALSMPALFTAETRPNSILKPLSDSRIIIIAV